MKSYLIYSLALLPLIATAEPSIRFENGTENEKLFFEPIYNRTKQKSTSIREGFKSETEGFILGFNHLVDPKIEFGASYAYVHTDTHRVGVKDTNSIDTQRGLAYIKWEIQPELKVKTALQYGYSSYDERILFQKSDIDVFSYGADISIEKKLRLLTPEIGLKYRLYSQQSYTTSTNTFMKSKKAEFTTFRIGGTLQKETMTESGLRLIPQAKLFITYDLSADEDGVSMNLPHSIDILVNNNKRLDRQATVFSFGLTADSDGLWEYGLKYEGQWRKDYYSHYYTLSATLNF